MGNMLVCVLRLGECGADGDGVTGDGKRDDEPHYSGVCYSGKCDGRS